MRNFFKPLRKVAQNPYINDVFRNEIWFIFPYPFVYLLFFVFLDPLLFKSEISRYLSQLPIYGLPLALLTFTLTIITVGARLWIKRDEIIAKFPMDVEKVLLYSFIHLMLESFSVTFAISIGLLSLFQYVAMDDNNIAFQFDGLTVIAMVYPFALSIVARAFTRESIIASRMLGLINQLIVRSNQRLV